MNQAVVISAAVRPAAVLKLGQELLGVGLPDAVQPLGAESAALQDLEDELADADRAGLRRRPPTQVFFTSSMTIIPPPRGSMPSLKSRLICFSFSRRDGPSRLALEQPVSRQAASSESSGLS